ncbi:hypothetical protein BC936DRAFT_145925 [Jimgerdemannia flammicorona]|uniref:Uncharacterized protein n=1 Tax=Jimgerdemannia flammicorona TaxID=994334 RepID=A0A433D8S0_9FUNG|nr:hypothetical protein BC936DRAFT_145925 [Jimgerdemannia flammicorona]
MSKKLYQSLQSSLPKAARAPFVDYNSSITDILKQCAFDQYLWTLRNPLQVCWMLSIRKHHLPTSRVGSSYVRSADWSFLLLVAREVFTPDNNPSDIGLSEACYDFLALWPCIRASVSGLGSELGNAKFLPGEIYLRAIDEVRKLRHQLESHMKVDGVVQIDFSEIELLSMEVTGHHGLRDKNRAGWDHIKGTHAALAMLSRIAYIFMHGSVELFQDVKVAFVHAHGTSLHLWLFNMSTPGIFVMQRVAKATVPAKFGEALLLCELINFLWTLRVESQRQ